MQSESLTNCELNIKRIMQRTRYSFSFQASYGTKKRFGNYTDFNPYFGTDYGICSIIKPQLAFNDSLDGVPYWDKIFGKHNWEVKRGVEVSRVRVFLEENAIMAYWIKGEKEGA